MMVCNRSLVFTNFVGLQSLGKFHCDEVLACFMLKQLEEYKDARM